MVQIPKAKEKEKAWECIIVTEENLYVTTASNQEAADRDVNDRNARAQQMGIKARYKSVPRSEAEFG